MRALEQEQENYKARLANFGTKEGGGSSNGRTRHGYSQSMVIELPSTNNDLVEDVRSTKSHVPRSNKSLPDKAVGSALDKDHGPGSRSKLGGTNDLDCIHRDMELMKDRFAKLLLGEDMSGGGKGVSSALALSNAITNLAASVFGEQRKLEPMAAETRSRWRKEIDWLTSVTDHIVEFVPSQQKAANGLCMEIMTTRQRSDLLTNIPFLRKLDSMLLDCLDNFKDQNEFYYVAKDAEESEKGGKRDDKWWLPTVKVPPEGLSDITRKWLHFQKDSVSQVLKAAMAINAQVLSEMEIPENYIDSLPKNGRASLGDAIYKSITVEYFDPDQFLQSMDLSSEHKILDLKNRIEASVVIWRRKMTTKDSKSPWGSAVSLEKRELFEERAETILMILKQRFPGISQSSLDISKIQFNQDVGHALLESYSRTLESLAHTVLSRIEDVLYADSLAQNPSLAQSKRNPLLDVKITSMKFPNPDEELERLNATGGHTSMTLSDFMGWNLDNGDVMGLANEDGANDETPKESGKFATLFVPKKSYLENLGGLRSPTSRH